MEYFVYIVLCSDGSLYTGITTDVARRIDEHNGTKPSGARYTRGRRPVALRYVEPCASKRAALVREAAIKRLTRAAKLRLIDQTPFRT